MPRFRTEAKRTVSGQRRAIAFWAYPVWKFQLTWNVLRDHAAAAVNAVPTSPRDELRNLAAFFLARRGSYEPFFYDCPTDRLVASQTIGTGDGATTTFPMLRAYASSLFGFVEPVGGINALTSVLVNGVERVGTTTKNSPRDGWLTISPTPGAGHAIVVSGTFYHRCIFVRDEADFENFERDLWKVRRLELETARSV